jgi:hypothetical protein
MFVAPAMFESDFARGIEIASSVMLGTPRFGVPPK